uniref:Transposable element P transposase n=1 Tax=Photinus pyralis TaxID=7054 RepID=A0A1Y1KDL4_PHOPY
MSVKRAAQVLSQSVSSAIKTSVGTRQLHSESALDTADFLDFIDRLFDCLDSRTLFTSNPYKSAFSATNKYIQDTLQEAIRLFPKLEKVDFKNGRKTRPPCFAGFLQTVNSTRMLFNEENKNGIMFILTNRLNQDVLENLFSIYRQKGGYCRNPSAKMLRTDFRSSAINCLIKPPTSSNCEPDLDIVMEVDETQIVESTDRSSSSSSQQEMDIDKEETLEDCAVAYFAGYLAFKCIKEFDCNTCQETLCTDDISLFNKNQLLIINKTYDTSLTTALKAPANSFYNIINMSLNIFEKYYEKLYCKQGIGRIIKNKIEKKIKKTNCDWLSHETCQEHRHYILNQLVHCKIFKKCKWFKSSANPKQCPKLRILKNR